MKIQTKPRISLGLFAVGVIAAMAMAPASLRAQIVPPNAGAPVLNVATVNYDIDDVPQPPVTDDEEFLIDALVKPVVTLVNEDSVSPGQDDAVLEYTVTNGGNQTQDFVLNGINRTGDDDDLDNLKVYIDDGDGIFDAADDTLVDLTDLASREGTPIEDLDPGDSVTVFIVGDVPSSLDDNETIDVDLVAVAYEPNGGIETETAPGAATPGAVDTIFGDEAGTATGDADEDGVHSDTGTLTVAEVTVTITKTAAVVNNGLDDGSTDQFYIPGATVRYTITIGYSGSNTTTAGSIVMTDPIPAGTSYVDESIVYNTDDTITDDDDTDEGDFDGSNNSGRGTVTIAVDGTRDGDSDDDVITFEVTID